MKFATIILSLLIILLSATPCSDGLNQADLNQEEIGVNHNHQEDSDDNCPITCICSCCGMSITYEPLKVFSSIDFQKISTQIIAVYQSNYRFDFHTNIWQPPQVIS